MKKRRFLSNLLVALPLWLLIGFFRLLPLDAASALGSRIGRLLGPRLKWHRIAERNLRYVWPELSDEKQQAILHGMWDNLGRVLGEYGHLSNPGLMDRISIAPETEAEIAAALQQGPVIFAAAHLANWELIPVSGKKLNIPLTAVYRKLNNPVIDRILYRIRAPFTAGLYPKGKKAAAAVIRSLRAGKPVGLLIDQKMNDGIRLPFLGRPAMSAPAVAELSLKFHAPVIMVRLQRHQGAHFSLTATRVEPPQGEKAAEEVAPVFLSEIQRHLEEWICEEPSQWFWVHQRWGKSHELPPNAHK